MNFIPLASSSKGNAYLVESGETRLLLECGVPYKKLQKLTGYSLSSISACLITHEHKDHCKCAEKLLERAIPVYATSGTAKALEPLTGFHTLHSDGGTYKPLRIGAIDILPFRTFHDSQEPVGYLLRDSSDKLMFATDTVTLGYHFPGVTIAAIECNHADCILDNLQAVPYRQRAHIIRTSNAHMSVGRCCEFLRNLDKSSLREVYLLHMSESHGDADLFQRAVQKVSGTAQVTVCPP